MKRPRLRIKLPSSHGAKDICDLQEAKHRFNWGHEPFLILVEKQPISSYEELIEFAERNPYKDREFLEVELQPLLAGG
jgi:hypothetical protein